MKYYTENIVTCTLATFFCWFVHVDLIDLHVQCTCITCNTRCHTCTCMLQISKRMSLVSRKLIATCARTKSKSKSKCVCIYSGNSTTLALGNRLWGADPTSTLFCPVPWAHFCGWPDTCSRCMWREWCVNYCYMCLHGYSTSQSILNRKFPSWCALCPAVSLALLQLFGWPNTVPFCDRPHGNTSCVNNCVFVLAAERLRERAKRAFSRINQRP
jgi:hypothetical protein